MQLEIHQLAAHACHLFPIQINQLHCCLRDGTINSGVRHIARLRASLVHWRKRVSNRQVVELQRRADGRITILINDEDFGRSRDGNFHC